MLEVRLTCYTKDIEEVEQTGQNPWCKRINFQTWSSNGRPDPHLETVMFLNEHKVGVFFSCYVKMLEHIQLISFCRYLLFPCLCSAVYLRGHHKLPSTGWSLSGRNSFCSLNKCILCILVADENKIMKTGFSFKTAFFKKGMWSFYVRNLTVFLRAVPLDPSLLLLIFIHYLEKHFFSISHWFPSSVRINF